MDKNSARQLVGDTFRGSFEKGRFYRFVKELLNHVTDAQFMYAGNRVPDAYKPYIHSLERLGKYQDPEGKKIDILVVNLEKGSSLERARTMQRNFIAWYLNGSRGGELKDAALVAFVSPDSADWRFSLVTMEYKITETLTGKVKAQAEYTPARRYSFLVGEHETSHTAQSRLVPPIEDDKNDPTLKQIEEAFNIEKATKEFFGKYRELFIQLLDTLDGILESDKAIKKDFANKGVSTADFAKKLLGQIVFLYFLQKKGWFGVKRHQPWGSGSKQFLRELFAKKHGGYDNFFNDILEPLFYEALRQERQEDYYSRFDCRIPFLNGGLFDPLGDYDWIETDILLPNELFSNATKTKEGDTGTGILDVFDRYNFTVNEDEPLEKEVAVDPEMLGKVFENLLEVKDRKSKGTYYTPREIVHYMCQESLINYLATELDGKVPKEDIETLVRHGESVVEHESRIIKHGKETERYSHRLPESIRDNAKQIDTALETIRICDPAVGSGAFPVGMMTEIIRARNALSAYLGNSSARTIYDFKRHAIQNCLYGVDIDPGAIEIAKLRLWLSLVVDEEERGTIQPLPNLDYKLVCGNSLLGVEHDLFNQPLFDKLEQLKASYFAETNTKKKHALKDQIEEVISKLTKGHKDFDFEVYFSEVFHEKGGFDVVIANPPYIDSEAMVNKGLSDLREYIASTFKMAKGNWDIYIAFFEVGFGLLSKTGCLTFITPDKWISKPFGDALRQNTIARLCAVVKAGRQVFEEAKVDAIVSIFTARECPILDVLIYEDGRFLLAGQVDKNTLTDPFAFDFVFSPFLHILSKFEQQPHKLSDLAQCESACATSDAYTLKPLIRNLDNEYFSKAKFLKVVNTGTIGKYVSKWGHSPMTYLKDKYISPVVERQRFLDLFRNTYGKKATIPKVIIKGLTLLDALIDEQGVVVPGKSTLIISGGNLARLKLVLALANSKIALFYIRHKYPSSSYNQGINFTKNMMNALPAPDFSSGQGTIAIELVDKILAITGNDDYFADPAKQVKVRTYIHEIDKLFYSLYNLTDDEIKIVEENC